MPAVMPPPFGLKDAAQHAAHGAAPAHANRLAHSGSVTPTKTHVINNATNAAASYSAGSYVPSTHMGLFGTALSKVNGTIGSVMGGAFMLSMAGGLLGFLGKIPVIGAPFQGLAKVAGAPQQILDSNTIGDIPHAISGSITGAKKVIDKVLGEGKADALAERVRGKESRVGEVVFAKANQATSWLGSVIGKGIDNSEFLKDITSKRAAKMAGKAGESFEAIHKTLGELSGHLSASELSEVNKAVEEARKHIGGSASSINMAGFQKAMESVGETLKGVATKDNKELSTAVGKIHGGLSELTHQVSQTHSLHQSSRGWADIKGAISSVPEKLKGVKLQEALWKTSIHAGNAMMAYSNVKQSSTGMSALKDMAQALTGKRPSTLGILFGSGLPETVKEARSQYMKSAIVRTLSDALGIFVNTKYSGSVGGGAKGLAMVIGVPMLVGKISEIVTSNNQSAECFAQLRDAQAAGQGIPPELIAQFIGVTSKKAKAAGGAENKSVQLIAQQYASEGVSPEQILLEIENGGLDQRRAALKTAQVEQARGRAAQPSQGRESVGTHTSRLNQVGGVPFAPMLRA